jgi:hypothetical protein
MIDAFTTPAGDTAAAQFAATAAGYGLSPEAIQATIAKVTAARTADAPSPPTVPSVDPISKSPTVADAPTSNAQAYERSFEGVSPDAYDLNGVYTGRSIDGDLPTFDKELRGAFSAMGLPQGVAKGMAQMVLEGQEAYAKLQSEPARQWYKAESKSTVSKVLGVSVEEAVKTAGIAFAKLPQATRDSWVSKGVLDHPGTFINLYRHAQRLQARA